MKLPDGIGDMDPHTQIVYEELADESFMTQTDLLEETRLPFRVVRDAISDLVDAGVVDEIIYSQGKRRLYRPAPSRADKQNRPDSANA